MPRMTDRWVERVRVSDRQEFRDDQIRGFGLRVTTAGVKTWFVRYTLAGERRRDDLGVYPEVGLADAREKAARVKNLAREGIDPRGDAEPQAYLVSQLCEDYLRLHARPHKKASSVAEDERMIRLDILPELGDMAVDDVTRRDVADLVGSVAARGAPVIANRTRALTSKIFAFAVGSGRAKSNPVAGTPRATAERPRDRVLSDEEVRKLWSDLESTTVTNLGLKLCLLTAVRQGQLRKMRWDQIDGRWWEAPADATKSGMAHRVYLATTALEIVETLRQGNPGPWVLASPADPWQHVGKLRASRKRSWSVGGWTPHDLRRTAATMMARAGVQPHVRSICLGHKLHGVGWIYDRWGYEHEVQGAFEAVDFAVARAVTLPPGCTNLANATCRDREEAS